MTNTVDVRTLYQRLSEIGLSKGFIKKQALPDWWNEEFEQTPGAAIEAAAYISRRLNLSFDSLLQVEAKPEFKKTCLPKFKTKASNLPERLVTAHCIVARIAEMVAYSCKPERKVLPESAQLIRNEILKERKVVDFPGLVNFCWNLGLPVIYFNKFPDSTNIHKFDGMVAFFKERPVIMVNRKHSKSAWLLFILAHELGHIIKGHVNEESLIDEKVQLESLDSKEIEANEFAVELLAGKTNIRHEDQRGYLTGEELAGYGLNIGERDNVDPGVVILNYAWSKAIEAKVEQEKRIIWATASKALRVIEPNTGSLNEINRLVLEHIDIDRLDNDSQDYLEFALAE